MQNNNQNQQISISIDSDSQLFTKQELQQIQQQKNQEESSDSIEIICQDFKAPDGMNLNIQNEEISITEQQDQQKQQKIFQIPLAANNVDYYDMNTKKNFKLIKDRNELAQIVKQMFLQDTQKRKQIDIDTQKSDTFESEVDKQIKNLNMDQDIEYALKQLINGQNVLISSEQNWKKLELIYNFAQLTDGYIIYATKKEYQQIRISKFRELDEKYKHKIQIDFYENYQNQQTQSQIMDECQILFLNKQNFKEQNNISQDIQKMLIRNQLRLLILEEKQDEKQQNICDIIQRYVPKIQNVSQTSQSEQNIQILLLLNHINDNKIEEINKQFQIIGLKFEIINFNMYKQNLNYINVFMKPTYENLNKLIQSKTQLTHTLIYFNHKNYIKIINENFQKNGIQSDQLYFEQTNKEQIIEQFNHYQTKYLCSTKEIFQKYNIQGLNTIINYQLPQNINDYITIIQLLQNQNLGQYYYSFINYDFEIESMKRSFYGKSSENDQQLYKYIQMIQLLHRNICVEAQLQQYFVGSNINLCNKCEFCRYINGNPNNSVQYYMIYIEDIYDKIFEEIKLKNIDVSLEKNSYDLINYVEDQIFSTKNTDKNLTQYIIYELILRRDILIENQLLKENPNPPLERLRYILYPKVYQQKQQYH